MIKETLEAVLSEPETEMRLRALRDSDEPTDRATFWRLAARLIPTASASEDGATIVYHRIRIGPPPDSDGDDAPAGAQ